MNEKPFRVIVTGSRDWPYPFIVEAALESVAYFVGGSKNMIIIHGACLTGADSFAGQWGMRHGSQIEAYEADWHRQGPAAGPLRNAKMVDLGADVCLAFIGRCNRKKCFAKEPRVHGSHGARDCANRAASTGIRTIRHEIWKSIPHG